MISTFSPNCTFPDHSVNYVGSPPLRSTLGIVWPCVTALIASIYTALHLDVIVVRSDTATGECRCNWCSRLFDRACQKMRAQLVGLSIATIALFAPELIAQRAILEWWWCKSTFDKFNEGKEKRDEVKSQWTMTHCYYVNMGGLRVRCRDMLAEHNQSSRALCNCEEITLRVDDILFLMSHGMLPREPPITKEEINDKSKANIFARITAIWQIVWFMVDVVTRLARGMPIAQLEVGVAGFTMLAIVTLCCYFRKPKGVNVATQVLLQIPPEYENWFLRICDEDLHNSVPLRVKIFGSNSSPPSEELIIKRKFDSVARWFHVYGTYTTLRSQSFFREVMEHLSVESPRNNRKKSILLPLLLAGVFALPFGAVHVAAWNADFPTVADQWLWRISSLVSMVVLLLVAIVWDLASLASDLMGNSEKARMRRNGIYLLLTPYIMAVPGIFVVCYIIARGILIVEMVRCMLFLPPGAYVTSWTTNVPHFG